MGPASLTVIAFLLLAASHGAFALVREPSRTAGVDGGVAPGDHYLEAFPEFKAIATHVDEAWTRKSKRLHLAQPHLKQNQQSAVGALPTAEAAAGPVASATGATLLMQRLLFSTIGLTAFGTLILVVFERRRVRAKHALKDVDVADPHAEDEGKAARKALYKLVGMWLTDPWTRGAAWGIVISLVLFNIVQEGAYAFVTSKKQAEVTNALSTVHETQDEDRVYTAITMWLCWEICFLVPLHWLLAPVLNYTCRIHFRNFLTRKALQAYLAGKGHAYYQLKVTESQNAIDNPDQRIAEDADKISTLGRDIFTSIFSAIIGSAMWFVVVYQVGSAETMAIFFSCSVLRTAIAVGGFGSNLVDAQQAVLSTAADFRYGLVRIRDSSEEIALADASQREYTRTKANYRAQINALWNLMGVNIRYYCAVNVISIFPTVLLYIALFPRIADGTMGFGDLMRISMGFSQLSNLLNVVSNNWDTMTELQANANRFNQLLATCDRVNDAAIAADPRAEVGTPNATAPKNAATGLVPRIEFAEAVEEDAFALQSVSMLPPTATADASPIGGLSLRCAAGKSVLIMGPSGVGKTSLLRTVSGLWINGTGTVLRPGGASKEHLLFLPIRSYMPMGTLRDLVFYPDEAPTSSGTKVEDVAVEESRRAAREALVRAQLGQLEKEWGLDGDARDWKSILSAGEQQRLAFARGFMRLRNREANSALAVLDEATSALDVRAEQKLYEELKKELLPGGGLKGLLSVGHRPTLMAFHDSILLIGECNEEEAEKDFGNIAAQGSWKAPDGRNVPWKQLAR